MLVGPEGEERADKGHRHGIGTVMIDLDEGYENWAPGDWKLNLMT
jgi:hypothetical protein